MSEAAFSDEQLFAGTCPMGSGDVPGVLPLSDENISAGGNGWMAALRSILHSYCIYLSLPNLETLSTAPSWDGNIQRESVIAILRLYFVGCTSYLMESMTFAGG